jgi:hypothetical protein
VSSEGDAPTSSVETRFAAASRHADAKPPPSSEKLAGWKLAVGIGGAVFGAPLIAILTLLVLASLLPVLLLELPFLAARSGRGPGRGDHSAAREAPLRAPPKLPAPSAT